jgi:hypothetical protein
MVLHRARWIHRRVEAISLLDEARTRRRISLDLTVPAHAPILSGGVVYLPITLLQKQVLSKFDVRDEGGAALSMLTKDQHDAIAVTMVVGMARQALARAVKNGALSAANGELHPYIAEALQRAVLKPPPHHPANPLEPWKVFPDDPVIRSQAFVIDTYYEARILIEDLSRLFIVFVPLRAQPAERRVLKLAFQEELPATSGIVDGARRTEWTALMGRALLLEPYVFVVEVAAGQAASYHADLDVPEDLYVAKAQLSRKVARTHVPVSEAGSCPDRSHLHPPRLMRGDQVDLLADLALRPSGFLPGATLIAFLTTAMLCIGLAMHVLGLGVSADAAGAVVVIVPAIFAPFLAVSATHRLVQRIVRYARLLLAAVTLISFAAAGSLVIRFHHDERAVAWGILAVLSLMPSAAFAFAWHKARKV